MRLAVTGANGFIGRNLMTRLAEIPLEAVAIPHDLNEAELAGRLSGVGIVFHLAGVNRPSDEAEFATGNQQMTERLVAALRGLGQRTPLVYASSIQAGNDTPYGRSKLAGEAAVEAYRAETGAATHILRLPNVFGKWCRPNYNSVVATFCHNIARGLPVTIHDPAALVRLVYIDDVVDLFIDLAHDPDRERPEIGPVYTISLGELAAQIEHFKKSRCTLITERVGTGLLRALYATYLSYLAPAAFDYPLTAHVDARGLFAEMLRTPDCGQFSFFTAHAGVTRGGHYHHTKTEKFLVVHGRARFGFRHIITGETHELVTSGDTPRIVETVPGWAHDITNIGDDTMVVMLWANELFDSERPDTVGAKVLKARDRTEAGE